MSNELTDEQVKIIWGSRPDVSFSDFCGTSYNNQSRNRREGYYAGWGRGKHHRSKSKDLALSAEIHVISIDEFSWGEWEQRMKEALSQPTLSIPMGLSREEKRRAMIEMDYCYNFPVA